MVLMRNELSASILRQSSVFCCQRATAMAASSDLFIVCRSGCDLMSICVVMSVFGLVTPAPSVGFLSLVSRLCIQSLSGSGFCCGGLFVGLMLLCVGVLVCVCLYRMCCNRYRWHLVWYCLSGWSLIFDRMLGWVPH